MISLATILFLATTSFSNASSPLMIEGNNFSIAETQNIEFVPLLKIDPSLFNDPQMPQYLNLRKYQSIVKSQGVRGACTFFAFTSLVESILLKKTHKEWDLSEEYLAWASKVQKKLRVLDEGSSVAVNAITFQDFGFMLEHDMPYQTSWFEKGYPCEGQQKAEADPICFSHEGPNKSKPIYTEKHIVFEAVDSRSIDLVQALVLRKTPITVSLIGHEEMWDQSKKTGDFFLNPKHKKECQLNRKLCSGHAVLAIGYDLKKRVVLIKNSWGEEWGSNGYGTIPFDYLDQMSSRKFLTGYILE
ncbi:MAG: C1 family peptidase [Bdellovibrionota bacterium]